MSKGFRNPDPTYSEGALLSFKALMEDPILKLYCCYGTACVLIVVPLFLYDSSTSYINLSQMAMTAG